MRSADETVSQGAALSFDTAVYSLAAGWTNVSVGGSRRAVVECFLFDRSTPASGHFFPAKTESVILDVAAFCSSL